MRTAVCVVLGVGLLFFLGFPYLIDLDVYRTGAQVFLDGGSIYGRLPALARGDHLPFTYPPIAAVLFTVFAVLPLWAAAVLLTVMSVGCLALTMWILMGETWSGVGSSRVWTLLGIMAVGLWFGPVQETLTYGQVNIILMALVVVAATRGRGRWWGGALVGIAIAIKLTPAVFLLWFLLRRDWRGMAGAIVSFLVLTGLGHLLMPADSTLYWTTTLVDTGRIGGAAYASNQSISGVLHRLGLDSTLLWFVIALAAGLLVAWVAWRLLRLGRDLAAALVVSFAALLCSPVSWGHHWVWGLALVVMLFTWGLGEQRRGLWWWLAVSGTFVFMARMHWWFPNTNQQELEWSLLQQILGASYPIWSCVALVLIGLFADRIPGSAVAAELESLNQQPATDKIGA